MAAFEILTPMPMNLRYILRSLPVIATALVLGACGNVSMKSVWPFGDDKTPERSRVPANAVEYKCAGGKRFYVRLIEDGASAWVILADREFRLDRQAAGTYGNGKALLDIGGDTATLSDGGTLAFSGCAKPVEAAAK